MSPIQSLFSLSERPLFQRTPESDNSVNGVDTAQIKLVAVSKELFDVVCVTTTVLWGNKLSNTAVIASDVNETAALILGAAHESYLREAKDLRWHEVSENLIDPPANPAPQNASLAATLNQLRDFSNPQL